MLVRAEIKCYHCGFVSGEAIMEPGHSLKEAELKLVGACGETPRRALRCCRCGGPVFLDNAETVFVVKEPAIQFRQRPWRRRTPTTKAS